MCFYVSVNNSTTQLRAVVIKNTSNKIKGLLRAGMTRAESAFLKIACTVFPPNLKAYLLIFQAIANPISILLAARLCYQS